MTITNPIAATHPGCREQRPCVDCRAGGVYSLEQTPQSGALRSRHAQWLHAVRVQSHTHNRHRQHHHRQPVGWLYVSTQLDDGRDDAAEPNIFTSWDGQQTLTWTGAYTVLPNNGITLGFGVLVSPTNYGTYSNTAAIRVNSTVSDPREIAVNNVAPIIVPLRVSDNTTIVVGGGNRRRGAKHQPAANPRSARPGRHGTHHDHRAHHLPVRFVRRHPACVSRTRRDLLHAASGVADAGDGEQAAWRQQQRLWFLGRHASRRRRDSGRTDQAVPRLGRPSSVHRV